MCPKILICILYYGAGDIPIYPSREDVRLALDHGVGVRMHDASGLHGDLGLHGALELLGGWSEALFGAFVDNIFTEE